MHWTFRWSSREGAPAPDVSTPRPRRAVGISPGLDTLAGARYSTTDARPDVRPTTEVGAVTRPPNLAPLDHGVRLLLDPDSAACSTPDGDPARAARSAPHTKTGDRFVDSC